jgi:hypothetical protein
MLFIAFGAAFMPLLDAIIGKCRHADCAYRTANH